MKLFDSVKIGSLMLALGGCGFVHIGKTRYVATYCVTRAQLDQLKKAQPGKVHDELTGQADRDTQILAGNLIRLRSYSDGVLEVLGGCVDPNS